MPADLFDYLTTYNVDFQYTPVKKVLPIKKPKQIELPIDKYAYKRPAPKFMEMETLTHFNEKGRDLPFDLFKRRKPCVNQNPIQPIPDIEHYERFTPEERRQARNTRPRVYMVPQVCLDDISEEVMYSKGGLVDQVYTSEWKQAVDLTYPKFRQWPKQTCVFDRGMEAVRYKSHCPGDRFDRDYVPVAELMKWPEIDKRRERGESCCMTAEEIGGCKEEAAPHDPNEELSISYQIPKMGYMGYVPRVARGVHREKQKFTLANPYVTTLMIMQGDYKKIPIPECVG